MPHYFRDVTGMRFGAFVAVEIADRRDIRTLMWKFRCDCGNVIVSKLYRIEHGITKRCNLCRLKILGDRQRLPDGVAKMRQLFLSYRSGAIDRGLQFDLTRDQFAEMIKATCHYCGTVPNNTSRRWRHGKYPYNGIDRVDNLKGYVSGNMVTACKDCNRAKGTMSYDEFLDYRVRLSAFLLKCAST